MYSCGRVVRACTRRLENDSKKWGKSKERDKTVTTGKALDGKPYAGNPHVRFDEGEVASCTAEASLRRVHCRRQPEGRASVCAATPRRGSLLYKTTKLAILGAALCAAAQTAHVAPTSIYWKGGNGSETNPTNIYSKSSWTGSTTYSGSGISKLPCNEHNLQFGFAADAEDTTATLEEFAQNLRAGRSLEEKRENLLHTMACKAAIKGGWKSDMAELRVLVEKVRKGEVKYCPHGRPVAVKLTKYELEKMFKRA